MAAKAKIGSLLARQSQSAKTGLLSGRYSNTGLNVTVFGAYGFVGRYIVEELGGCRRE